MLTLMRPAVLLLLTALPGFTQVKLFQSPNSVFVEIDGKPFTALYYGGDLPKPYLHPLRSAKGTPVTRLFPMEKVANEADSVDHLHHRGLWLGYGYINGFNFWENESSYKEANKGTVVPSKPPKLKSDGKTGVVTAYYDWLDPESHIVLKEVREMSFYLHKELRVIDFDITFTAEKKVDFGDTKEGFFALRVARELQEGKGTGRMTNAEGAEGEKAIWGKQSSWVDYAGTVNGEAVGIAIFDHPSNLKFPTRWHARAYGLFAANPFGAAEFDGAKSPPRGQAVGEKPAYSMNPGQTLRLRYRVVIHPGDTKSAGIGSLYSDWAKGKRP